MVRQPIFIVFFVALFGLAPGCATGGGLDDAGSPPGMDAGRRDAGGPSECGSCAAGTTCRGGACVPVCDPDGTCPGTRTCCSGACVSTDQSLTDCGGCDVECGDSANTCSAGSCMCGVDAPCADGLACCSGRCADFQTDFLDCGECGRSCLAGQVCEAGECVEPPCNPPCAAGEVCGDDNVCRCGTSPACTGADVACCDGACTDTTSSVGNCGECGVQCVAPQVCLDSSCTADIPCDPVCADGLTCVAGECRCGSTVGSCPGGQACCNDTCTATTNNEMHCGGCNIACTGSSECCGTSCVDTQNGDENNCGGCGNGCPEIPIVGGDRADTCMNGQCFCGTGPICPSTQACVAPNVCLGI